MAASVLLEKADIEKLTRPELIALCKKNSLRTLGMTSGLVERLSTYYDGLRSKQLLAESLSSKPQLKPTQPTSSSKPGLKPLRLTSSLTRKPSLQSTAETNAPPPIPRTRTTSNISRTTAVSSASALETTKRKAPRPSLPTSNGDGAPEGKPGLALKGRRSTNKPAILDEGTTNPTTLRSAPNSELKPIPRKPTPKISVEDLSATTPVVAKNPRILSSAAPSNTSGSKAKRLLPPPRTDTSPAVSPATSPRLPSRTLPAIQSTISDVPAIISRLDDLEIKLGHEQEARQAAETQNQLLFRKIDGLLLRIDAQDSRLRTQDDLFQALQEALGDTHDLLIATRHDVLQTTKVDIASCISQCSVLSTAVSELRKSTGMLEREVVGEEGTVRTLVKELGDIDVAIASERDRILAIEQRVEELALRMDDSSTSSTPASATFTKTSKRGSIVGGPRYRKQSIVESPLESTEVAEAAEGTSRRDRRLSRASLSASIHGVPPAPAVPSATPTPNTVGFPSTANRAPKAPWTGNRHDFKFPPEITSPRSPKASFTTSTARTRVHSTATEIGGAPNRRSPTETAQDNDEEEVTRTSPKYIYASEANDASDEEEDRLPARRRPNTANTKKTTPRNLPPAIMIHTTSKAVLQVDEMASPVPSIGDAVSVSISDLEAGVTSGDELLSLLHQPQPSFGFWPTDDEHDVSVEYAQSTAVAL